MTGEGDRKKVVLSRRAGVGHFQQEDVSRVVVHRHHDAVGDAQATDALALASKPTGPPDVIHYGGHELRFGLAAQNPAPGHLELQVWDLVRFLDGRDLGFLQCEPIEAVRGQSDRIGCLRDIGEPIVAEDVVDGETHVSRHLNLHGLAVARQVGDNQDGLVLERPEKR